MLKDYSILKLNNYRIELVSLVIVTSVPYTAYMR